MTQGSTSTHAQVLRPGLVALAATLPFANSLGGFTFDDLAVIRDNPLLRLESPLPVLQAEYFYGGLYRPLTMLTYFANAHLAPSPASYHLVNLALHVLVSVLVFYLVRALIGMPWIATVAALLFAVHPIHTEAVTSIVGRAELLATLCVLVTLLTFLRARMSRRRQTVWTTLSLLAFLAGLLAKEGAFAALPLLFVVHVWAFRKDGMRQRVRALAPYAILALAVFALRWTVLGSLTSATPTDFLDNPLAHVSWRARWQTAIVVLMEYVSQLALPWNLSADYSFNQIPIVTSVSDPRFLFGVLFATAAGIALFWSARRAPVALLASLLMLVPLAITANFLFPIGTIKAERLLYLPSVGWCFLCAWIAARMRRPYPRATMAVLMVLIAAYAGRTWARNTDWSDNLGLFEATVRTSPSSAKAHHNLATAYFHDGRLEDALLHYRRALEIHPVYTAAAFGVGRIHDVRRQDAAALYWYERALRLDWGSVDAHLNTGTVRLRLGEIASAEASFLTGLRISPEDPRLLVSLALVRQTQGSPWSAESLLEKVERSETDDTKRMAIASLQIPRTTEQP